jgi:hypothetical protein
MTEENYENFLVFEQVLAAGIRSEIDPSTELWFWPQRHKLCWYSYFMHFCSRWTIHAKLYARTSLLIFTVWTFRVFPHDTLALSTTNSTSKEGIHTTGLVWVGHKPRAVEP